MRGLYLYVQVSWLVSCAVPNLKLVLSIISFVLWYVLFKLQIFKLHYKAFGLQ